MSSSSCCFFPCMQISQQTSKVVWYSHLLKNFPVCGYPHCSCLENPQRQRSLAGVHGVAKSQLDMTEQQSTHARTWIFMFTCDVYMWLSPIGSHHINCTKQGFLYGNHPVCVDHNKLWTILQEMGIPDHLTCLLRNLYTGQEATVRTGHGTTDWFQIRKRSMSRLNIVTLLI